MRTANETLFKKGHKKIGGFTKGSRHSDESKVLISQSLIGLTEERSRRWKGDQAGYAALHIWIKKKLGRPMFCFIDKRHTSKRFTWANISREYKRDLNDWIPMCPGCHAIFDKYKFTLERMRKIYESIN